MHHNVDEDNFLGKTGSMRIHHFKGAAVMLAALGVATLVSAGLRPATKSVAASDPDMSETQPANSPQIYSCPSDILRSAPAADRLRFDVCQRYLLAPANLAR